ncbi:MAG: hypothetical protein CMA67_02355 [Euryarchaeota archaeon]|nr:hypothetical protein [Euryarchaeota archaeon]|tara:strand:+ start:424 stop:918 length:495 start_codon:yes stop_codon:yes gene_type:complete
MDLVDLDNHPLAQKYPVRLPVWWCRTGEPGPHPDVDGATGKTVVLRFEKRFGRVERLFAKLMRAPHELRRPLLDKNSTLWELCNGQRTFSEICHLMNDTFHESVSPVVHRTHAGIKVFIGLNVMKIVDHKDQAEWYTGPGRVPQGQQLSDEVQFEADTEVRTGD